MSFVANKPETPAGIPVLAAGKVTTPALGAAWCATDAAVAG